MPANRGAAVLAVQPGAVVYPSPPAGRDVRRATVWRLRAAGAPATVAEVPLECAGGSLTMSADGRRAAIRSCVVVAARPGHDAGRNGTPFGRGRAHHPRMLAAIRSAAVLGVDAYEVIVEVDVAHGLPSWTMVGTKPRSAPTS